MFSHTDAGDLIALFSDFFDTTIGGKKESDSYRNIAEEIGFPASSIMFLFDLKEELYAAKTVGYLTTWLTRDYEADTHDEHPQVCSFDEIILDRQ